ncbi:hypothetical protein SDC9_197351 [bioreactor metagenome]|uniref:Uncharacterized protein n=1 Tax=bioreactor metagenome TaxID=1076179 RepID=A0A645IGY5_9ZZZZ
MFSSLAVVTEVAEASVASDDSFRASLPGNGPVSNVDVADRSPNQ